MSNKLILIEFRKASTMTSNQSLLKNNKSLTLFLVSRVSTALAYQMITVAIGWQIYALTKSPFYLGLVGLIQFLPMLLLTFVSGFVADRFDRRRIVAICQAFEGLGFILLALANYQGWVTKEFILIIAGLIGTVHAFQGPPMQSLLPNIVPRELFPRAAALVTSAFQTATIIGPALGGILYALNPSVVYITAGLLSITTSLLINFISVIRAEVVKREPVTLGSVFAGLTFIRSKPIVLGAISLDLFAVLFGGATALLPIYASEILKVGPTGLGMLRSAPAVGALIMAAVLARRPLRQKVGRTMFIAVTVFGLATISFALSTSLVLSLIILFIMGAADVISMVIRSTLVQMETPDSMRGRVSSVNLLFIGTSNQLGEFESGITAAWFGTVPAVLIGGIGTVFVVCLWMRLFPQLLKVDKLEFATK